MIDQTKFKEHLSHLRSLCEMLSTASKEEANCYVEQLIAAIVSERQTGGKPND